MAASRTAALATSSSGDSVAALPSIWWPMLVGMVLFVIMAAAALWNWQRFLGREELDVQSRFTLDVEAIGQNLSDRLHAYEVVLRGVSGAFTGEEATVSKEQWEEVMERLQIQLIYPGISSLAWSRVVRPHQLDDFLARIRDDYHSNLQIFPQGARERYNIIEYVSPLNASTRAALGLDLLTQNGQNHAIMQATDLGDAILSTPLMLYPDASTQTFEQMGAFMYLPVYQTGLPPNRITDRRKTLLGTINLAFRGQALVTSIFGSQLRLFHIRARDLDSGEILFDSGVAERVNHPADWQPRFQAHRELSLHGRIWALDIVGTPEYEIGLVAGRTHNLSLALELLISALIALMAAVFLWSRDRKLYANRQITERLRQQASQLMLANRYKSEFLANMSHELRTPLNSILILSDQLRQNAAKNLNEKQIRHADIIHRAGGDLLQLINDVLDLAKIEAGRMQATLEPVNLADLLIDLDAGLQPLAEAKGLNLHITTAFEESGIGQRIQTDRVRLHQILRNLLSNAIKFTDKGQVQLMVSYGVKLDDGRIMIHFAVRDTGIGIAIEQQEHVFNAFTQIDGSTRRRFGGTGLGLAITKQLVEALDGTIELQSTPGLGSTFTVKLPCHPIEASLVTENTPSSRSGKGQKLLIVEDDKEFATTIIDKARASGFACVHCVSGNQALELLGQENFSAIILDLLLPDISGWQLFRHLRAMPAYRTAPVHIISCLPNPGYLAAEQGTHYLTKPLDRQALAEVFANLQTEVRNSASLLLVEDVDHEREQYGQELTDLGFSVTACANVKSACDAWKAQKFDVLVIDLNLPDGDGFSLLEKLDDLRPLAGVRIVVNTGVDMSQEGLQRLDNYSAAVVCKKGGDMVQLGQAVQGFLGQMAAPGPAVTVATHPAAPVTTATTVRQAIGRRLLLVDDDVRNVYAMSALLDDLGFDIITASNGEEAIEQYQKEIPDLILMDMSMPVMDGYTATNLLKNQHGAKVPIIAMTAHAMVGDREKCLAAGTDDYIAKPVKREELQRMMERWLMQ